jgi:hypothetical protein
MSLTKLQESRLSQEQQAERIHLRQLVDRYMAVRPLPRCRDRDSAERGLELALARYGHFEHNGWVWCWSEVLQSITRQRPWKCTAAAANPHTKGDTPHVSEHSKQA